MHGSLFSYTEAELIHAAKRGDGAAFADLVQPQYKAAFRVAYGLLHDASEAEDVVQEAAFKAWRRLGNLREGSSLKPWFLAIVANQCRDVSGGRWWSVSKVDPPEGDMGSVDVAAAVDLRRALRRLSHDDRLIVVLRYYLDMPFEEIATTLGITPKAARHRVERAVHRLRPIVQIQGAAV
ncbi:MAG: RNA polymerase sigma factor [Candidatus Dormiibacterota bacterium]